MQPLILSRKSVVKYSSIQVGATRWSPFLFLGCGLDTAALLAVLAERYKLQAKAADFLRALEPEVLSRLDTAPARPGKS